MDRQVSRPTKEQVRAYMHGREHALRPPPPPDEIRRQLGWKLAPPGPAASLAGLCLLPAAFGQLAVQTALGWCVVPLSVAVGHGRVPRC
ncbi:MAG TPA: hypothetical protein VNT33_03505 [Telluria sp.]|nr:hypothetical protein [Telluria sp.]